MNGIRRWFVVAVASVFTAGMTVVGAPTASAYGAANWQVAFSGNFNNTTGGGGANGFWGWCDFAGSSGGLSGSDADCAFSEYFFGSGGASTGFLTSVRVQGNGWATGPCTMQPCLYPTDFYITGGTVTLTGPFVVQMVAAGQVPPGCTVTGSTATCPIAVIGGGSSNVDTGVPAAAGHYSLANLFGSAVPPGDHIDIQVTQVR